MLGVLFSVLLISHLASSLTHVEFFDLRETAYSEFQTCKVYHGECCVPVDIGLVLTDPVWYAFRPAEVQVTFVPGRDDDNRDATRVYELPVRACQGAPAKQKKLSDLPRGSNKWWTGDRNKVISSVSYGDGDREDLVFPENIRFMGHSYDLEPEGPGPPRRPLTYKYAPVGGVTHVIYGRPQTVWPWGKSDIWCCFSYIDGFSDNEFKPTTE